MGMKIEQINERIDFLNKEITNKEAQLNNMLYLDRLYEESIPFGLAHQVEKMKCEKKWLEELRGNSDEV